MFNSLGLVPLLGLLLPASHAAINLGDSRITLPPFEDETGAWSAAPTPPPNPRFAAIALKRQVGGPTCGYYQYNSEAFDCYTNQRCATSGTHFGCVSSSAAPYTACLERTNTICSKSIAGVGTLCCNYATDFPFCVTALKPITKGTVTTITGVRCGNSRARGTKVLLEVKGRSTITSSSAIRSSSSTRSSSRLLPTPTSASTPPTSNIDSLPATSSLQASSETATATETSSPPPSSAPVGAIVGGVIGGLAVLGMSTAAVVWLLVRKRNRNPDHNGDSGGAASMSQPYTYDMGGQVHPQAPAPGPSFDAYKGYHQTNMSVNNVVAGSEHPYYSAPTPSASPSLHQQHSRAPSHSPASMPMTPDDYVVRPVSEMPAINPPGMGNNASELPA